MIGVALLLVIGAVIAWAIAVGAVAWEALHPPRRTTAWALARGTHPDPEPIERPWRLLRHELADGTTLPYWEIDGDDANGAVVVIVHGWGRSRWDSLRRVGAFLPRASRLVLPDLRGHGEADGRTSLGMREPADLVDLLARLDVNAGSSAGATAAARALVLVGHSLGAGVIVRAAAALEPPPAALVALAPYETVATPIAARLRLRALPAGLLAGPATALLRAVGIREAPLSRHAAQLRSPMLVVSSRDDAISPAREGERIAAAVPNSRGRITVLPGSDHADPGAEQPSLLADAIDRFLDDALLSGPPEPTRRLAPPAPAAPERRLRSPPSAEAG